MSTYIQPYMKPLETGKLSECELIKVLNGAYYHPPKQTETSCDGYRNPYTKQPSNVCNGCSWFSDNTGGEEHDRSGTDKSAG